MQGVSRSSVTISRALAAVAVVVSLSWAAAAGAGAGVESPEERGRDACLNGAMYLDAMVGQEAAFMDTTDRFVASQRAAYPEGLVLDGTRAQDEATQTAWEDAFWQAYMFSWVRTPGAPTPTGPNAGFQDSYNYTASQREQWEGTRSSCRTDGPGAACRRMVKAGDAAIASAAVVYDAAWTFSREVGVRSQNAPGALYARVPRILDALAESASTANKSAIARATKYTAAEKRCVKSMGYEWPLPEAPGP